MVKKAPRSSRKVIPKATREVSVRNRSYSVPGLYRAACVRVIDGDTFEALVDLGMRTLQRVKIRLTDIDTPALKDPDPLRAAAGKEAAHRLGEILPALAFGTWPVRLAVRGPDPHDRWVAEVWVATEDGERNVQETLLAEGLATPWPKGRGEHPA